MKLISDLHIHSKYSQATGKDLDIDHLEKYARLKGVDLLGTGDFTHPIWIKELKSKLTDNGDGIVQTESGFPFALSTEISLIYTQERGRKIHNIVLAPSFDVVDQITEYLLTKGRVDYDGRPIFKIPCPEFVESLRSISKDIEVIPAHIWTPWFSMFGSKSGFDTVEECFGDQTKHINSVETGLSSDPEMNWRLSQLDPYNLVSFSDLHSFWPWRMGREATVFDMDLKYQDLLKAVRTGQGLAETIEVDPNYGKYHLDGHRNCDVRMDPKESNKLKKICPKCGKPMTIGVLNRVEELADRPQGYVRKDAKPFRKLLPLSEIISHIKGRAIATKTVWSEYYKLVSKERSEYYVLLKMPEDELHKITDEKIAETIIKNRKGEIRIRGGYDGTYGEPLLNGEKEEKHFYQPRQRQMGLDDWY